MVESIRQLGEAASVEQRSSIRALPGTPQADAPRANQVIRPHGELEHRVHWGRDVAMGEESKHTRNGESAQKLALNSLRQELSVHGVIAVQQKRAGWDHAY
jgi:hypothetical protein